MRLHKQIRTLFQHRTGICKCRFEEALQLRDYPAHKRNCEPTVRCSSSLGVVWARCCDSPASLRLPPFDNRKASKTVIRKSRDFHPACPRWSTIRCLQLAPVCLGQTSCVYWRLLTLFPQSLTAFLPDVFISAAYSSFRRLYSAILRNPNSRI